MECIVCMEEFNAVERRPKCLPCGHTVCSQCLGDLQEPRCPYCREDLTAPATAMPDNYIVLDLVGQRQQTGPSVDSDSHARSLKPWCRDCNQGAAESCLDNGHTLCSLRKLRSERAAATLQQLGDAATAAAKVVRTLEDAKDAVEGLLQEWRARLRQVQQADRELRAAVDEGGDLKAGQPKGLQQLQDAASLLEGMECALRHHGGAEWRGDLGGGRSLLHALVLHLHRHGRIKKEPPQQESAVATSPPARDCIEELNLNALSCLPGERQEERAAALARVRQRGVRRMTLLRCYCDPAWALGMLRSAAPTLEELSLINPHEQHLLVVHAMPNLRRLMWWCKDGALDAQPPLLPALPRSSLKWLHVTGLPRPTLISLLRAHSACLEVLWLCVGTPGGGQWPAGCDDLDALLGQCGLRRVSKVVLIRRTVFHNSACREQVSAVRRVLPAAAVQCMKCDKVVWENL